MASCSDALALDFLRYVAIVSIIGILPRSSLLLISPTSVDSVRDFIHIPPVFYHANWSDFYPSALSFRAIVVCPQEAEIVLFLGIQFLLLQKLSQAGPQPSLLFFNTGRIFTEIFICIIKKVSTLFIFSSYALKTGRSPIDTLNRYLAVIWMINKQMFFNL